MLTVTEAAKARMLEILSLKSGSAVLRIVKNDRRLRLRSSVVRTGDQTFSCDGRVVLTIDRRIRKLLETRFLELCHTPKGRRLRLLGYQSSSH